MRIRVAALALVSALTLPAVAFAALYSDQAFDPSPSYSVTGISLGTGGIATTSSAASGSLGCKISADKTVVNSGATVTLTVDATNADYVSSPQGIREPTHSVNVWSVAPGPNTYKYVAFDKNGSVVCSITIMGGASSATATTATGAPMTTGTNPCTMITKTLSRGSRGADVSSLQQFLLSQKLITSDSVTGFFGSGTEAAVQKFQIVHTIVAGGSPSTTGFGAVGAKTRAAICSMVNGTSAIVTSNASAPGMPPPPPTYTATSTPIAPGVPPPPPFTPLPVSNTTSSSAASSGSGSSSTNGVGPVPVITTLYASPNVVVVPNDPVNLVWETSQAAKCDIQTLQSSLYANLATDVGTFGSHIVYPTASTTYALNCFGIGNGSTSTPASARKSVTVSMLNPPPTCKVSSDKTTYLYGNVIKFTWTTDHADGAAWQRTVMGDSLRLPYGPMDLSGTAYVAADIVGSETVGINVTGKGGTGSCTTSLTISASTTASTATNANFASAVIGLQTALKQLTSLLDSLGL
ncbi:MAG: peptidoglycan-binding protein [Candidatus Kaiserbacteria bacterium]|nr:peptidoglycan-binding protein [Candidatus Kaiserbacteria bacterium]